MPPASFREGPMTSGRRESASPGLAPLRGQARRSPSRPSASAVGFALAVVATSITAFAPDLVQMLPTAYQRHVSASRKICGQPYKLQKPDVPQFTFHDPRSRGIRGLAFCANDSFLAAADRNGHVYLWSMATHKIAGTLSDPRGRGVNAVAYRPGGKVLATADANGSVYLWPAGRARPHRLADHRSRGVRAVAFSPNGKLLAAADGNGHTYIWSLRTDRVVATLHDPGSSGVKTVAFGPGGTTVATGDADGRAYVWALARTLTARLTETLRDQGSKGVRAVAFERDGKTLAVADANGRDYLWPVGHGTAHVLTDPVTKGIDAEGFTPSGKFLATADLDGHLFFWLVSVSKVVEFGPVRAARAMNTVAFSPDGRRAAAGTANGAIYITDVTHIGISVTLTAS
jgi:WD40 repeat protein